MTMGFGSGLKSSERGGAKGMFAAYRGELRGWMVGTDAIHKVQVAEWNKKNQEHRVAMKKVNGLWKKTHQRWKDRRIAKGILNKVNTRHHEHSDGFGKYFEHIIKDFPPLPLSEDFRRPDELQRLLPTIYLNGSFPYALRERMVKTMAKFFATPVDEKVVNGLHHKSVVEYKNEEDIMFLKEIRPNKDLFKTKTNPKLE